MASKLVITAAKLEMMVRLGLINSTEQVTRKLLAAVKEDRKSAGDSERGRKSREAGKRGGRPKGSTKAARVLAEYKRRRPKSNLSDSRLAEVIGKEVGLGRRASIKAIGSAKKVRSKPV